MWKESQKNYLQQEQQKVTIAKLALDNEFMVNTKIKLINDNIYTYKSKISNMESLLSVKETELKEKERMFKEIQRQRTEDIKGVVKQKNSLVTNNEKIMENELDKNIKQVSLMSSQNNTAREHIESLRREKKAYQNIEQRIAKEIDAMKKNYASTSNQLDDLVTNRLQLEDKMNVDAKIMEKEAQLATMSLMTMQEKLLNENKKIKTTIRQDKGTGGANRGLDDTMTVQTGHMDNYSRAMTRTTQGFSKKHNRNNTFIIKETNGSIKKPSISARKPVKVFNTNRSEKSFLNDEYLVDKEDHIKQRCEHIRTLLAFLHKETNTMSLDDLIDYYITLEEENKEIYKEIKALVDELDALKDQKLAMVLEIKNVESCKERRTDIKETIIEESKKKVAETQSKIEVLDQKCAMYKKIVRELKLSMPVILNKLIFDGNEDTFEIHGDSHENVHHQLYNLERKANYIFKLVKECNLELFVFENHKTAGLTAKSDENKARNDITMIEEMASKLIRE